MLILDTYETLNPLDGWLREQFLPRLPADALVVLAGRNPPSTGWRADPGWRDLLHTVSLRNFRPEESRGYLSRRGLPEARHRAVLEFTHGHPLALSLVVEVMESGGEFSLHPHSPDIVRSLLERFVQALPSPQHRAALETAALVRRLTEPLLAAALDLPDTHDYFEWLRGLSFMEHGTGGLFPHDLAREALDADLRWRNPDWYTELHRRLRHYYTRKLLETRGAEQQTTLFDDVYLHRHNPMVKPFLEWSESSNVFPERGSPEDQSAVLEMVRAHEGEEAAELASYWLGQQPDGLTVYRSLGREPVGFLLLLGLHKANREDLDRDPLAGRVWRYAQRYAPVRPGEEVSLFRFWMAREGYQGVSPVQSVIFINAVQHYVSNPRLAWSFFPAAEPEFWAPAFLYMSIHRVAELDYVAGEHRMGVFAHDWRAQPVAAWLEMLGERELATDLDLKTLEVAKPAPLVVLSQPEFEEAVRDALRDFTRPSALVQNPLLRSRLVAERAGNQPPNPSHLQTLVREAAANLKTNPKDEKLYRVLERTYLEPAATQEVAAELLDLPFSTYRRHLKSGLERLCAWLWERELYGMSHP